MLYPAGASWNRDTPRSDICHLQLSQAVERSSADALHLIMASACDFEAMGL
jgi:hypothetical protein